MAELSVYGGAGEIGGNKILVESGDAAFLLDFGASLRTASQYFDEFLKVRGTKGLLDPIEMGVLPPLKGIYRDDLLPPGEDLWSRFAHRTVENLGGVLLTHAHFDHIGCLSYLRPDLRIFTTPLTAFIAKAMQDMGSSGIDRENCWCVPREPCDRVLRPSGDKPVQRPFVLSEMPDTAATAFWKDLPGDKELQACKPSSGADAWQIGGLSVECFPVDHSLQGACAFSVDLGGRRLIYTGDLRRHGRYGESTERFINAAAAKSGQKILVCEGTNISEGPSTSEEEVHRHCLDAVKGADGLVIADFGARNVERLLIFHAIARETGRRLCILPKDAYLLRAMRFVSPDIPAISSENSFCIYSEARARLDAWEKETIWKQYADLKVLPEEIAKDPGSYLLCFSFWDLSELIEFRLRADLRHRYIYSTSEAHSEEQKLDLSRLRSWLDHFGIEFFGDAEKDHAGLHSSGHMDGAGLKRMVEAIRPDLLIPVHTEHPQLFAEHFGSLCRVVLPEPGKPIEI